MQLKNGNASVTRSLCSAGIIAALYFALTVAFYPVSYGAIQVRVSEALCVLPLFYGEAVLGLTAGCLLSNLVGTGGLLDVALGTPATLIAALLCYLAGKKIRGGARFFLGVFPCVILNALVVPLTFLAITELKEAYFLSALQVGVGEAIAVYVLGGALYFAYAKRLEKTEKL